MRKIWIGILIVMLMAGQVNAAQWRNAAGENTILGAESASDIDAASYDDIVAPLDRLLSNQRRGCILSYASASTLTVGIGEVVCSNADGSIRLFQKNTSAITATWAMLDTGSEAASTTFYVYAIVATATDSTFTVKISASSSVPSSTTYYKRLGSFYNDANSNITLINNDNDDKELGALTSKTVAVTYQALTDGFIMVNGETSATNDLDFDLYTDANSTPTTRVAGMEIDGDGPDQGSFTYPIKKGDYYKVTRDSSSVTMIIYWIGLQ